MGTTDAQYPSDRSEIQDFTRALLDDVRALERMLDEGLIESGVRRIGAEQEMFLIQQTMEPGTGAMDVLEDLGHPQFTTELGVFNLEANLNPQVFDGDALWRMEQELEGLVAQAQRVAHDHQMRVLLVGILPTLRRRHLGLDHMSPASRYAALNRSMLEHAGGSFRFAIKGLDELELKHDNVMFEACNTSFQIHMQVAPEEFAALYNVAQAVTGPVLAAAVNSPVFLQKRLWSETRVALMQQSIDVRRDAQKSREVRPRVVFGDRWVDDSVIEILREDIARFRVLLSKDRHESSLAALDRGEIPELRCLSLHNGTVYRWNRPCYGINEGKPHLRIEHRSLPAGPTVVDEMANAAFFFGLMVAFSHQYDDIRSVMRFDDAKHNFVAAARDGLNAQFRWIGSNRVAADELILNELLPAAREGLKKRGIRASDVDRYMGTLEERVRCGRTGSQWAFDSLESMGDHGSSEEGMHALTSAIHQNQHTGHPVHQWPLADLQGEDNWRFSCRRVEQVMTRDLFTVRPDDLVDLAATVMDWRHIRHVPVEDDHGHLVGLVTYRQVLRLIGQGVQRDRVKVAVREIMNSSPYTVTPETSTLDAIAKMREHKISCLVVVDADDKLMGIVSERDFMNVASILLDRELRET